MARFDLTLEELRAMTQLARSPPDLDAFWAATLAEAASVRSPLRFERIDAVARRSMPST